MEMLAQQKDQETKQLVLHKDKEIGHHSERNTTLMKGVLQLSQQVEQLKQIGVQKDQLLTRLVQRVQELEHQNLQLTAALRGLPQHVSGGFDQPPPPPPAVH